MSACERCWGDAYVRSQMLGGHQADHYRDLLDERNHDAACERPPKQAIR